MPHCRGGLTFLFRQESKQRSRPGKALKNILSVSLRFRSLLPRILTVLPRTPSRRYALVVFLFIVVCRKLVLLHSVPTPTQVARYDTSLPCCKSYLVLVYCRLAYICYLVPDHILATLWVCGIVIVFCKFRVSGLFLACDSFNRTYHRLPT